MIFNEVYDVVDTSGNKIGTATWTECHTKGLLHQVVHGLVFKDSSKKEVLIKKRGSKMVQGRGLWEVAVAGHMLAGRTSLQEIRKELQEELFEGHKLPKDLKIKKITKFFNNDVPNKHEIAYLFEIIYPGPFHHQKEEVAGKPTWINFNKLVREMRNNNGRYAQYSINDVKEYLRCVT